MSEQERAEVYAMAAVAFARKLITKAQEELNEAEELHAEAAMILRGIRAGNSYAIAQTIEAINETEGEHNDE